MVREVVSMADIEATALRLGIHISSVDLDSIQLPAGEDIGIKGDDDEDLYQEDSFDMEAGVCNIIVVDNLLVVRPEKIYSQIGLVKDGGLWMPVNPDSQKTLARKLSLRGRRLVVISWISHIFARLINLFDDFEKYMKVPDEWTPAEIKPYTPGENLQQWLTDEKARDQVVIRATAFTEVFWNDPRQMMPYLVYS